VIGRRLVRRDQESHALAPTPRRCTWPILALLALPLPVLGQFNTDLIRAQCEAVHQIEDQSILYGLVTDGRTGMPIPGATVRLEWTVVTGASDTARHTASAESTDGTYIFCDVPQGTPLRAFADAFGGRSDATEVLFEGGESHQSDLAVVLDRVEGVVRGQLLDSETDDPISGAVVSIRDSELSALSDANGNFTVRGVPIGSREVVIQHVAYGEPRVGVTVDPGSDRFLSVRLEPRAIAVAPIEVEVSNRPEFLVENGFYDRKDSNLGQFVTPEMIRNRSFARFHELLRAVPGLSVKTICSPHCYAQIGMSGTTQSACIPTFYMDGRRIMVRPKPRTSPRDPPGLIDLDALAITGDLAGVEVYRSIAETPAQFYGRCGSIVIWSRRGG
jgi:hypothetical protein